MLCVYCAHIILCIICLEIEKNQFSDDVGGGGVGEENVLENFASCAEMKNVLKLLPPLLLLFSHEEEELNYWICW